MKKSIVFHFFYDKINFRTRNDCGEFEENPADSVGCPNQRRLKEGQAECEWFARNDNT